MNLADFLASISADQLGYVSIYETATGRIRFVLPANANYDIPDGMAVYDGDSDLAIHYISGGDRRVREYLSEVSEAEIDADGIAEFTFGIVAGTSVTVNGSTSVAETTDTVALTTDIPGTYLIEVEPPFPYLRQTITVKANAV